MPWQQNKRTGEWREVDANGNPVSQAPQGGVVAPNPIMAGQRNRDNARQDRIDAEARAARKQAAYDRQQALEAEMTAKGFMRGPDGQWVANPTFTPPASASDQKERRDRIGRLNSLVAQINRTQELGDTGPLATSGFGAIADYNPFSSDNARFDTAGASLSQQGLAAFKVPGTGTVSDRDAIMFDRANLPQSSTLDSSNQEVMRGLRGRVEEEYNALGLPAPNWVMPLDREYAPRASVTAAAGSFGNAITGNTRMREQNDPETAARAKQAWLSGASYDQVNQIHKDAGYDGLSIGEWNAIEPWRKKGRGKEVVWVTAREVPMSRAEELAGSPTGAALAGIANAGSFGGVQRLAPEQMQAIQDLNPKMSLTGEVIGSIGGASMVGKLGQGIAGRLGGLGSKLATGGGRGGNFARGVGTDAAYAGIYGENTGQGVLPSAGLGALGSAGGRLVGGILGKGVTGFARATGADELVNRGIPLTTGQQLGGMAKSFEDRLTGVPMIGDVVNARRTEGFEGLQRSLQNEAGAPIGARFDGGDWREALPDQFGQAYDDATAGVNVPLDEQFMPDLQQVAQQANQLPPDLAQRFSMAMDNRVQPIANAGQMTGETYQQGMRGLSGYKAEMTKPGFEQDYRGALSGAQDVLKNQMLRGGGDQVVEGLGKADRAYRLAKVLQDAQTRATGGTLSGVPGLPAPSQLLAASTANAKKFGGHRPFGQILDAAQQVMPSKIGDSGTAGRLAQMALPAALVGGGGTGYATGGDASSAAAGTLTPLAIAGLLALGGTKGGQSAINATLFKRPAALKSPTTRRRLGKLQGLFGAASVPLMLESGN